MRSYLLELTADILAFREHGDLLLPRILDSAGQKGTGRWTAISALDAGSPATVISAAVFARVVSALRGQRERAAAVLPGPGDGLTPDTGGAVADLEGALRASQLVAYAQGFALLADAGRDHGWSLDLGQVARLWRAGCIIRADLLDDVAAVFDADPGIPTFLLAPAFREVMEEVQQGWRRTVARGAGSGIPLPATGSALAFYDAYRRERLPANLIQAQRDFFGAHGYQRLDRPESERFTTRWAGGGTETPSDGVEG
jgi:6-phosphogluconate dehydrogenase